MTTWLILARAVHIGAGLLLFGIYAFDRFVAAARPAAAGPETGRWWRAQIGFFNLFLLPAILLSGLAWFALVAMSMSGQGLRAETLEAVWSQTQFGTVWELRLIFWLVAVAAAVFFYFSRSKISWQNNLAWAQLFFSGVLLGSLAWAGHGQETSSWHLLADILHLLVAGFWPAGLWPFALLFYRLRRLPEPACWLCVAWLVRRFSAISLGSVALLTITGFINAWFLVGTFAHLLDQAYGRWLALKIILFCLTLAVGAQNFFRLKPRLTVAPAPAQKIEAAMAQLQFNVRLELFFSAAVIVVVAVLGILPPDN